eukprot:14773512-Alexandrium_andersonii.AAC.1
MCVRSQGRQAREPQVKRRRGVPGNPETAQGRAARATFAVGDCRSYMNAAAARRASRGRNNG